MKMAGTLPPFAGNQDQGRALVEDILQGRSPSPSCRALGRRVVVADTTGYGTVFFQVLTYEIVGEFFRKSKIIGKIFRKSKIVGGILDAHLINQTTLVAILEGNDHQNQRKTQKQRLKHAKFCAARANWHLETIKLYILRRKSPRSGEHFSRVFFGTNRRKLFQGFFFRRCF